MTIKNKNTVHAQPPSLITHSQLDILGLSPLPQRFINVQHAHVREVRDTSDCFQSIKSRKRTIFTGKYRVKHGGLEKPNGEAIGIFYGLAEGGTEFGGGVIVGAFIVLGGYGGGEG